jgi:retron-type reverse transcriptase
MLTYLNVVFQAMYEPTEAAMGFVLGRSIADNASVHVGKYYVFNTDLKDFFPSIQQPRIWAVLQLKPFSLNKELASVIAGLCCMQDANGDGVLPQGSPCSPILTNIICRQLDRRLTGLAKRFNLKYTRYADDITFSSDYNVFQDDSEFMTEFKRIIADQHFIFNDKKTRLQKSNERQEVTGLVVNEKVNVVREYVRDIRNLLYIWKRYGYEQAYAKFFPRYVSSKAYRPKNQGMPSMESVIAGKLLYLRMVMGEDSSVYSKLVDTFETLCPDRKKVVDNNLTYEVSYRIDEFESLFNTLLTFKRKEETSGMSGKSKTTALCKIDDHQHQIAVNVRCDSAIDKYLANPDNETLAKIKKRFYISLCLRGEKKFWLITRARMTNEHKTAYKDEYKAKVNPDFSWQEIADEEIESAEYLDFADLPEDEFIEAELMSATVVAPPQDGRKKNSVKYTYDEQKAEYKPLNNSGDLPPDNELDEILSAFVSSNFDLKTLDEWDKTKKN